MAAVNQEFLTEKVQRILSKYPYGLTYNCLLDLKSATEMSNIDIAKFFGLSIASLDRFKANHERVLFKKETK